MARQTSFRFTAVATPTLEATFARYAGAARFAYNQCLRQVIDRLRARRKDLGVVVPWSGFSLVNYFNTWKRSEHAGRTWAVDPTGQAELVTTGLAWRNQISAQVFEEAAIDLGRALTAFRDSKAGRRKGRRVGFPRSKRKGPARESFRLRNRLSKTGTPTIRVGTVEDPRVVMLPSIGSVRVIEDTRALRRLLRPGPDGAPRARIWYATVARHRGRWIISLSVQAPDLHPGMRHQPRDTDDHGWYVGLDRGLVAYLVAATANGEEVARIQAPRRLVRALPKLRRAGRAAARKRPGSRNRVKANRRLGRIHGRVADQRRQFTHVLSRRLVKTHDRLCLEDLAVANLARNRHLARPIADAAWGQLHQQLSLGERTFRCPVPDGGCGLVIDRDRNAAVNLAAWAEVHHHAGAGGGDARVLDLQAAGRVINACGGISAGRHGTRGGETGPQPHPRVARSRNRTPPPAGGRVRTPEKGAGE